ncbi:hypothetical protein L6452_25481 [Arctium lappa]|uniref:Uncharacterized protein n=1 Tax=Arctium lappa TaxID=4217 RepID=A0ACB9AFI2_ARCLA|nr:hypothetical protein L6452_25481 [Arctium lappa]
MNLLLMPDGADLDLDLIQWLPFLLARKLPIALDMAKDSNGRDSELPKRMNFDSYMCYVVRECYASCKNILNFLIKNDKGDKDDVEIVLLIMLEVVTRDIIVKESISSLTESSHGGSYGNPEGLQDKQYQKLFGDPNFPVTRETQDLSVAHLLDRLVKDIVKESDWFRAMIQAFCTSALVVLMLQSEAMVVAIQPSMETVTKKKPPTKQRRVVVTRMGVETPIGNNPNEFYNNLLEGVSGISENVKLGAFDCSNYPTRKKILKNGWVAPKLSKRKRMDRFMLYMLTAGKKALADGGITEDQMDELDLDVEF